MDTEKDESDILSQQFQDLQSNDFEFTIKCSKIVLDIQEGSCTILQLIEQMKGLLIDPLPINREKGMIVLSRVLEMLPKDFLSSEQLSVICAFYSDRLNDHHQVIPPVLKGILVLMQYKSLPDGVTKQVLTSLFQNVPCQQQQQSDRLIIYQILKSSLDNRFTEMLEMNFDFVYGVISAMDGERDPRNLLYLFNFLPKYLKTIALGHLSEEMFEVMACYFPVDFRAPSQDPDSISRDTLAESLCKCLCAIPEFAEYCLPLSLEKLSSALRIAKIDSLNLILEGCKTFEVPYYIQHSRDIWSQIQREVLQNSDQELEDLALKTLETVLNKLSKSDREIYQPILSDIIDTLKGNLLPNGKLFTPSTKIIYHTAKSSGAAANFVITQIVPLLINTFNITNTPDHQVLLFKSLVDLVQVYIEIHNNYNITGVKELSAIPNLCIQTILHENNNVKAVGLSSLAVLSKSLPVDIRNNLYQYFCIWLVTPQSKLVREATLKCFRSITQTYCKEVEQNVLDKIQINNKECLRLYLDSLIVIADMNDFTEVVLSIIVTHCLKDIDTVEIATGTLKKLLETFKDNTEIYHFLIDKSKFTSQILVWIKNSLNEIDTSKHKALLENISKILKILIGYQPSNEQFTVISLALDRFLQCETRHIPAVIILLHGLLTGVRRDVYITHEVPDFILDYCILPEDEYIQQVAFELLANLLNKDSDEQRLQVRLFKILTICTDELNQKDYKTRVNVIALMAWVTKALVMRGHVESDTWTSNLVELLYSYEQVAKGFKTIMCDNYDCLNSCSNSNKRLLYQQKFFVDVSNKLAEAYNGENSNYLLALGYLLQEAPKQIFILQFNKIFRLVVMSLERCEDEHVLCAMLEALYDLIITKESLMEQHIQEFLPRFLQLAIFENSMRVRMKALQCIQSYAIGFPVYKLLLHKQDVVLGLTKCLDDKKRLVRKEAVEARNRWFMIDAPV